jgi:hypothetical protein
MWPLCQVLVEELPVAVPAPLADVALLTLFGDLIDLSNRNCRGRSIRSHGSSFERTT